MLARAAGILRSEQFTVAPPALPGALLGLQPLGETLDPAEPRAPPAEIEIEGGDLDRDHLAALLAVAPDAAAVVAGILERLLQVVDVFLGTDLLGGEREELVLGVTVKADRRLVD